MRFFLGRNWRCDYKELILYTISDSSMKRRNLLNSSVVFITSLLAGCQGDYSAGKTLAVRRVSPKAENEKWEAEITVANDNVADDSSADFHNVTILGYSREGKLLCRKDIGDVTYDEGINNGVELTLTCSEKPDMITFDATEDPSDNKTFIEIAVYSSESDYWVLGRYTRDCEEGLPPNPRRGTTSN